MDTIKSKLKILETDLQSMPKYNRQPCKHCEYKIICAGECDKTLKPNNGIRCPSLYMGQPTSGVYQFIIDDTGVYRMTAGYIKSHNIKIDQTLNSEELFQIGVIVNQVMKKEVK